MIKKGDRDMTKKTNAKNDNMIKKPRRDNPTGLCIYAFIPICGSECAVAAFSTASRVILISRYRLFRLQIVAVISSSVSGRK